jgi:hypothetical protein
VTERTDRLSRDTVQRIAQVAPAGLGSWPEAWRRTRAADVAARAAVDAADAETDPGARSRALSDARGACTALVAAWRGAALAWCGEGCPS